MNDTKHTYVAGLAITSTILAISALLSFPHGSVALLSVLVIGIVLVGALIYLRDDENTPAS